MNALPRRVLTKVVFKPQQIEAIELLIHRNDGETIADIAKRVGVSAVSIYNWLKDPRFQLAYTQRIDALLFSERGSISKKLIDKAKGGVDGTDSKDQLPAMRLYYQLQGKLADNNIINVNNQYQANVQVNNNRVNSSGELVDNEIQIDGFPLAIKRLLMYLINGGVLDKSIVDSIESFLRVSGNGLDRKLLLERNEAEDTNNVSSNNNYGNSKGEINVDDDSNCISDMCSSGNVRDIRHEEEIIDAEIIDKLDESSIEDIPDNLEYEPIYDLLTDDELFTVIEGI